MVWMMILFACVGDVGEGKVEAKVEAVPAAAPAAPAAPAPAPAAANAETKSLKVDVAQSSIQALGAKVTATHPIKFPQFDGSVVLAGDQVVSVAFTVQTATLEADHPKLTEHLKTPDFFDVEKFPTATFQSSAITPGGDAGATHTITGNLSLHGQTKQVTFPATVTVADGTVTANTEFVLNRQDFGLSYPGKADDLIQDKVVLTIKLQARG